MFSKKGPLPLTAWPVGQGGMITELKTEDKGQLQKLISLGLIPNVEIILLRNRPCWIVQVGFTRLALDAELAEIIMVG
ncbi:MAG: ferrous iron transport protein A [Limnochordia bacterium]